MFLNKNKCTILNQCLGTYLNIQHLSLHVGHCCRRLQHIFVIEKTLLIKYPFQAEFPSITFSPWGEKKIEVLVKDVFRKLSLSACSPVKDISGIKVKRGQLQFCLLE